MDRLIAYATDAPMHALMAIVFLWIAIVSAWEAWRDRDLPPYQDDWYRSWRHDEIRVALLKGKVPRGFEDYPPSQIKELIERERASAARKVNLH